MLANSKIRTDFNPHLHIAIPAMDEMEWLPRTLASVERQGYRNFSVHICVNQPEEWWQDEQKRSVCEQNTALLQWLAEYRQHCSFSLRVIDRSSTGNGWIGKQHGVGWARKTLFDNILASSSPSDLVVSLDADTEFGERYFETVVHSLATHPQWVALSVPYYHRLTGDAARDRAILRYEIYMRTYALNMLDIGSPYAFTAIGSAIVVRATALRKIGGITPMKSGEDFYLLQKLRKMGEVGTWCAECVYPAARYSDRVIFGTGPAMKKGAEGDWSSYPIYARSSFDKIAETYRQIDRLYTEDIDNDFIRFLQAQFKTNNLWGPLRANARTLEQFRHSFHEKADGLRILQFLRQEHVGKNSHPGTFASANQQKTNAIGKELAENFPVCSAESLDNLSTQQLSNLRDQLFHLEMDTRKKLS